MSAIGGTADIGQLCRHPMSDHSPAPLAGPHHARRIAKRGQPWPRSDFQLSRLPSDDNRSPCYRCTNHCGAPPNDHRAVSAGNAGSVVNATCTCCRVCSGCVCHDDERRGQCSQQTLHWGFPFMRMSGKRRELYARPWRRLCRSRPFRGCCG
jgi:hypothetical protein